MSAIRRWQVEGTTLVVEHDPESARRGLSPWLIGDASDDDSLRSMFLTDDEFNALLDTVDQLRHEQPASPEDDS